MKKKTFLLAFVYANPLGDATNKGVTSGVTNVYVECEGGNYSEAEVLGFSPPVVVLEKEVLPGRTILKPMGGDPYKRAMNGGNWVYTSDSRFSREYGDNPVKVYDRFE